MNNGILLPSACLTPGVVIILLKSCVPAGPWMHARRVSAGAVRHKRQ